jgi:type I restriction enzyme S subunit
MSEWIASPFKNYFEVGLRNGLTKPSRIRGHGLPMVNMKEIFGYDVITDKTPMELVPVSDKELESSLLQYDDLLFARQSLTEEGAGKISIYKGKSPTVFESHLIRCRIDKDKADPNFIYYLFKSPYGKGTVSTIVQQVAAAGIKGSDLQELEFTFPPLQEQKAIANVLSSLDDKIDLLHRQNKTLESMAETLFRQWFVEDVQEDWEVVKLKDIVFHVKPGTNYQPKRLDSGIPFLNVRNLKNGFLDLSDVTYISEDEYIRVHKNWQPEENDVLISRIGTLGIVAVITKNDLPTAVHYNMINVKAKLTSYQFIYFLFKSNYFQELYASNIRQSVQEYVAIEDVENIELKLPINKDCLKTMEEAFKPIHKKITTNEFQIRTLQKLRDTLLPKLMSGEVRVAYS